MEKQELQVGDIVYCIDEDFNEFEDKVINVYLDTSGYICYTCFDGWDFYRENIGNDVFKNKEDRTNYLSKY